LLTTKCNRLHYIRMTTVEYYDGMTPEEWKPILGSSLNFHFGFYRHGMSFEEGLELATRNLFPYLPPGGRVLDLGCGWGGPAMQLLKRGYDVECVTNSCAQQEYCSSLGLHSRVLDLERDDARDLGYFDGVIMLESLEHILDKHNLFARLKYMTSRVVLVTSCDSQAAGGLVPTYGGTMYMTSVAELLGMITSEGWRIHGAVDNRRYAMPTFEHWRTRIEAAYPSSMKRPVEMLYALCEIALADIASFEKRFPLLLVSAVSRQDIVHPQNV
jgi:cyclopropane fatty-acyl-phospholipid synthase-like methyltransferase